MALLLHVELENNEKQQATHDQLKATYDQIEASKAQIISQQVAKGFEQLGSKDNVVLRLGGIYSLEGVMNTSEQYHKQVLEGLCAFVRDGTKADTDQRPPATDIQAAITVIGRRTAGTGVIDSTGSHISKTDLSNANLSYATLRGDLSGGALSGANLSGANLRGVELSGASLRGVDLSSANLRGVELSGASLRGVDLSSAKLSDAYLRGVDLSGANLGSADLRGVDLGDTNVSQSELDKACGDNGTNLPSGLTIKPCPYSVIP